ncbi:hypothetical protein RSOLAG22IIIB_14035 [Rhizoctonia solani]|uniref:Uncharacterized protein n=1 Tax=Rhizoctonia solani TaxID=456999 RepID=A0A0K6FTA8_9AGAM|nr:hypothetical protein RSOLAG22IIIB_14035 [Rhizoctonia solani]
MFITKFTTTKSAATKSATTKSATTKSTTTKSTTATITATTTTSTVATKMFNSVELVLMLMSMFACVTKDVRTTVMFLLEIVFGYEPLTRRFGRKPKVHEVRTLFQPLSALATLHCAEYTLEDIQTEADALAMVFAILRPILVFLTPAEFAEIHKKADDAIDLMICAPLSEVQDTVARWAADARSDVKFRNWLEWSRDYAPSGQTDIKPVGVSKAGAIIAQHLSGDSAAISTSCSLRRTGRVEKRQREDPPLDSFLPRHRPAREPLPARPCPVHVIVTSPTVPYIWTSSTSLVSLSVDFWPFVPSHRGAQRRSEERIERGALDTFKFPAKSMETTEEPTTSLDSSDNWSTTDGSDITSYTTYTDEESAEIPTSRTSPNISSLDSPSELQSHLKRSQSAPELTNAPRTRSPSEIAAHGTLGTLCSFDSSRMGSPGWRAFSISSSLCDAIDPDTPDWCLRMRWLEHEDDSLVSSRGGSIANLADISYESFGSPGTRSTDGHLDGHSDGLSSPSTPSDSTATTPNSSSPATSVENLVEEWAEDWQTWELDAWSNALTGQDVELYLDTKARRVEIRRGADSGVMRLAKRIGGVFGI